MFITVFLYTVEIGVKNLITMKKSFEFQAVASCVLVFSLLTTSMGRESKYKPTFLCQLVMHIISQLSDVLDF